MSHPRHAVQRQIEEFQKTRWYADAVRSDPSWAVCLIGYLKPAPVEVGSNATRSPVRVKISRTPDTAAKEVDLGSPLHPIRVLRYVWTAGEQDAHELKRVLDRMILGVDPDMTRLRHSWRDLPEWEVAWDILLSDAIAEIQQSRAIEVFSDEMRVMRVIRRARSRMQHAMRAR